MPLNAMDYQYPFSPGKEVSCVLLKYESNRDFSGGPVSG